MKIALPTEASLIKQVACPEEDCNAHPGNPCIERGNAINGFHALRMAQYLYESQNPPEEVVVDDRSIEEKFVDLVEEFSLIAKSLALMKSQLNGIASEFSKATTLATGIAEQINELHK